MLQLVNLIAVPLWAGQVVSGASISAVTILKDLLELVLIPLSIGLLVRWRYPDHATSWQPGLVKAANLALGLALVAGIPVNWSTIVSLFGSLVLLASLTVVLVSLAAGYFTGGKNAAARASTGLVSGVRFSSLGLIIIGTQLHGNPSYLGPAIVFALVDTIVPIFVAVEMGRRVRTSASGSKPAASHTAPTGSSRTWGADWRYPRAARLRRCPACLANSSAISRPAWLTGYGRLSRPRRSERTPRALPEATHALLALASLTASAVLVLTSLAASAVSFATTEALVTGSKASI